MSNFFSRDERHNRSFVNVRSSFTLGVLMIGTPKSLSIECVKPSILLSAEVEWLSSYSGILTFPLFDPTHVQGVLWLFGGSCGSLVIDELGLSLVIGFGRMSTSKLILGSYHDVDSSKTTSRLTRTFRVEGLKHLYPFCSSEYPARIHFFDLGFSFCCFSLGLCTYAIEPNILTWDRSGSLPVVLLVRGDLVHAGCRTSVH